MFKFIKFEIGHLLRSPMVWVLFAIITFFATAMISVDSINLGGGVGSVHKNAPFVIQTIYGLFSIIGMLFVSSFMTDTAIRDYEHNMYQFVFVTPITERDYYFGKFIGVSIVSLIPLLGVSVGCLIGPLMPWATPERYGAIMLSGHLQGIITFAIPTILIFGGFNYSLTSVFRNKTVSIAASYIIMIAYILGSIFASDIESAWIANLLDPFGGAAQGYVSKYMTVDEKNISAVGLTGWFLWNRILWIALGLSVLIGTYFKFSFTNSKERTKEVKIAELESSIGVFNKTDFSPSTAGKHSISTLYNLIKFELKAILLEPTFLLILALSMVLLIISLFNFTVSYGSDAYATTNTVFNHIRSTLRMLILIIILTYSGLLVWRGRESKFGELQDASPIKSSLLFLSKLFSLIAIIALFHFVAILMGIVSQIAHGYTNFEIGVYVKALLINDVLYFSYIATLAIFLQYVINKRNIATFAIGGFVFLIGFLWNFLEIRSNMVKLISMPQVIYSDMNGFGPFVQSAVWFHIYWALFCVLLTFVAYSFYQRGKDEDFKERAKSAGQILLQNKNALIVILALFLASGSYIFYNTKVLNTFISDKEWENIQVEYEQQFKQYEGITQPRIYKINYAINLMPSERNMNFKVEMWARNISNKPINELHFSTPSKSDSMKIVIDGATIKLQNNNLHYRILSLQKPLNLNDSILITVSDSYISRGFENEVSNLQLTQNGTFFKNMDFCPSLGYSSYMELTDKSKREKRGLPKRTRMAVLDDSNMVARANCLVSTDADWVEVNTIISTDIDQIAVAPGSLLKSWSENGRSFFQYKLDHQSLNFYAFISAKFEVARKKWNGIDLEVYYIKEHSYNVPNMLRSLEKSLDYYTKNFGPYYHKQARILEFPYGGYAQSFPGTMPYSEGVGFVIDLRKVTDEDIDMVYYVVAHEMAHQYWAHQVTGAKMQGCEMLGESFAQYSALMVMEKEYGKDKMKKFLKYELDGYLAGRGFEFEAERSLMKCESQQYIHYKKGSVVMYYLKEMVGEEKVNEALKSLVDSFAYKQPPYPTSLSAIKAFRKITPDSLQYLIDDMFENITLFSNHILDAKYTKVGNEYEVTLKTSSEKFRADSLGKESSVPMKDYVDIAIFGESTGKGFGKPLVYKRIKITEKENNYTFKTTEQPIKAGIDPYNYLIDRISDDNVKTLTKE